jgi:hypothetical protein
MDPERERIADEQLRGMKQGIVKPQPAVHKKPTYMRKRGSKSYTLEAHAARMREKNARNRERREAGIRGWQNRRALMDSMRERKTA